MTTPTPLATTVSRLNPDAVGVLHVFFRDYYAALREMGVDGNLRLQRYTPEFFLTCAGTAQHPLLKLNILFDDKADDQAELGELEYKVRELGNLLNGKAVQVTYSQSRDKALLYEAMKANGATYFLSQQATRQLSELPAGKDGYGVYKLLLQIVLVGFWLLLALVAWDDFTFSGLLVYALLGVMAYGVYAVLKRVALLPGLHGLMVAPRLSRFGSILAECQAIGNNAGYADVIADVPPHLVMLLSQIPAAETAGLLDQDTWRLNEMRSTAQQAVAHLSRYPESSPDYAQKAAEVEALIRTVLKAFESRPLQPAPEAAAISALHAEVNRHAELLSLKTSQGGN